MKKIVITLLVVVVIEVVTFFGGYDFRKNEEAERQLPTIFIEDHIDASNPTEIWYECKDRKNMKIDLTTSRSEYNGVPRPWHYAITFKSCEETFSKSGAIDSSTAVPGRK